MMKARRGRVDPSLLESLVEGGEVRTSLLALPAQPVPRSLATRSAPTPGVLADDPARDRGGDLDRGASSVRSRREARPGLKALRVDPAGHALGLRLRQWAALVFLGVLARFLTPRRADDTHDGGASPAERSGRPRETAGDRPSMVPR